MQSGDRRLWSGSAHDPPTIAHGSGFDLPIAFRWLDPLGAGALASAAVGTLSLGLRLDYLAIVTFGVALAVQFACLNSTIIAGGPFGIGFGGALQAHAPGIIAPGR